MSWLRNHKHTVCRLAVGAAALSLICFIWTGVNLYRNRKPQKLRLRQIMWGGEEAKGTARGTTREAAEGTAREAAREAAGTAGSGTHTSLAGMWLNIVENGTGAAVM